MDIVISKVNDVPGYFEQFCSILKSDTHFKSLVPSIAISYILYNHEKEIQECIQVDDVLLHLEHLLTPSEKHALSSSDNGGAVRNGMSRKEYFITLLKSKMPHFNEQFMEYLAMRENCPHHTELYQLLKSLVDSLQETFSIISPPKPSVAISKYRNYLKQLYTEQLKLVAEDSFEGPHIQHYVNLSLIIPEQVDDKGDYFKVLMDPYEWLFNYKEKTGKIIPKSISISEIFNTFQVSRQVILIQGTPGSGKTTLANKICMEWAMGRLIQEFLLVVLLRLRDPRVANMTHISELILHSTNDVAYFASEASQEIECREGEGVLLVLEGWDELSDDKQQKSLFASMISKNIFSKASILITSRPSSIGSIKKIHVTRNIAILGFSEDQIKQYLTHCFPDPSEGVKSKLKQRFLVQLNSYSALKSLACIPVNLSILVHVFKQCGQKLPNSLTELYKKYVLLKLNHHNQRISNERSFDELESAPPYISESLYILGELSFYELQRDNLIFTEEKINEHYFFGRKIPLDYDGMGLLQVKNYDLSKQIYRTYTFLHRTIQEFLAAWFLKSTQGQETFLVEIFDDKAFRMVWVFYAGLTVLKGIKLNHILASKVSKEKFSKFFVSSLSVTFKIVLKNSASSQITRLTVIAEEYYVSVVSRAVSNDFLLVLANCCAEAQNPTVCKEFSNGPLFHEDMCYIKIPDSALASQILSSLSYCITHSDKKWKIECPHLSEQNILNLHQYFGSDQKEFSGQLTSLVTYTGKSQIEIFLMLLCSQQCALAHLDLSHSKTFGDFCAALLADTLKLNNQLYKLELSNCEISSKGILAIAEMLTVNDTLEWLNLTKNCFTSSDLLQVLTTIKANTSLRLMEVDDSLIDQDINMQLKEINKGREHILGLSEWYLMKGSKVVDWGKRKVNKLKAWFEETFD